jgi:hypothetical protein
MDQSTLVTSGQALVKALDQAGLSPRMAVWVHNNEIDSWKLWLVPPKGMTDKHEFYRRVSEVASKHRTEVGTLSASDTEMVLDTHPAVQGLGRFLKAPNIGSVYFSGNRFNNYYLPDGIILRSNIS